LEVISVGVNDAVADLMSWIIDRYHVPEANNKHVLVIYHEVTMYALNSSLTLPPCFSGPAQIRQATLPVLVFYHEVTIYALALSLTLSNQPNRIESSPVLPHWIAK
jgi:hypothetical protein